MTGTTEARTGSGLSQGDRIAIVAGGGRLPLDVIDRLVEEGRRPTIVAIDGECELGEDPSRYDLIRMPAEHLGLAPARLKQLGMTHVVMAGAVTRRPAVSKVRLGWRVVRWLPALLAAFARGDDGLLRIVVRYVESFGLKVVGPHEVVPDLLAAKGAIGAVKPQRGDWRDIMAAFRAAKAIGGLDIGQAAIAVGGRVIALEGVEGTDGLLSRTRELRSHGRIAATKRGVLVKCAKPAQEMRVDLPTIGPRTVDDAHAAGLAGIAVEAGRSLVLDQGETVRRADALGLFLVGITGDEA